MAMPDQTMQIDPQSGLCNSTFYSKRPPMHLPSNSYLDITSFISSFPHNGDVALIDSNTGRQLTYPQLWRAVQSLSSCLSDLGMRKGHVVLLLSPNSIFFPVICLSVMHLGGVITTTNPLNTVSEIGSQIADSKPSLAFTTRPLLPKLANANLRVILIDGDGRNYGSATEGNLGIVAYLEEMLSQEPSQRYYRDRVSRDDPASLLYSSGTTGKSKGVVSSHKNLTVTVQNVLSRINSVSRLGHQTVIATVPMFHIYGLAWFVVGLLASGSTVVVLSKFEMQEMLSVVTKYRVTYLPIVPPVMVAMINNADKIREKYDLSSVQSVLSGGSPLSKEIIEGFLACYPTVQILQGYGLTETTGLGSSTDSIEESRRYGTAGLLAASLEAKIIDIKTGRALSVNKTGELWLRGPSIMKGYLNNEEATGATIDSDGWLRTGDLCYIDEDGYIFVVDRLKELIKYKGYQVPPAELETILLTHPQIEDAAVIPFPDKEVGQFPMAYVVRKLGSDLSGNGVMDFVASQVAPYKKIRRVAFVSTIPKNPSGKILRKDLIKLATSTL
ncbi:hypothetical protein GIB67_007003 [Kingdonia uniflora]|uniref:4-coumarate--CoA ligase n=1 Tax=Kingdonia uniflora TaxID=39325 RepID=A0A7J7NZH6_9MAGN|nr:hypothetical protein GIB67_007003 [Kingdonia uniflora]